MGRTVTLVLVDAEGAVLGALPPVDVALPWWQEVADVVAAVRARDGLEVQVLRLLRGLPGTLGHGDLHPGNVRADGATRVIVDWGDSTVTHPGYDILRLAEGLDRPDELIAAWAARWRATVPGCDPERAVALIRPVAQVHAAAAYADFLDRIEPAERPYHEADVPARLRAAAAAARTVRR